MRVRLPDAGLFLSSYLNIEKVFKNAMIKGGGSKMRTKYLAIFLTLIFLSFAQTGWAFLEGDYSVGSTAPESYDFCNPPVGDTSYNNASINNPASLSSIGGNDTPTLTSPGMLSIGGSSPSLTGVTGEAQRTIGGIDNGYNLKNVTPLDNDAGYKAVFNNDTGAEMRVNIDPAGKILTRVEDDGNKSEWFFGDGSTTTSIKDGDKWTNVSGLKNYETLNGTVSVGRDRSNDKMVMFIKPENTKELQRIETAFEYPMGDDYSARKTDGSGDVVIPGATMRNIAGDFIGRPVQKGELGVSINPFGQRTGEVYIKENLNPNVSVEFKANVDGSEKTLKAQYQVAGQLIATDAATGKEIGPINKYLMGGLFMNGDVDKPNIGISQEEEGKIYKGLGVDGNKLNFSMLSGKVKEETYINDIKPVASAPVEAFKTAAPPVATASKDILTQQELTAMYNDPSSIFDMNEGKIYDGSKKLLEDSGYKAEVVDVGKDKAIKFTYLEDENITIVKIPVAPLGKEAAPTKVQDGSPDIKLSKIEASDLIDSKVKQTKDDKTQVLQELNERVTAADNIIAKTKKYIDIFEGPRYPDEKLNKVPGAKDAQIHTLNQLNSELSDAQLAKSQAKYNLKLFENPAALNATTDDVARDAQAYSPQKVAAADNAKFYQGPEALALAALDLQKNDTISVAAGAVVARDGTITLNPAASVPIETSAAGPVEVYSPKNDALRDALAVREEARMKVEDLGLRAGAMIGEPSHIVSGFNNDLEAARDKYIETQKVVEDIKSGIAQSAVQPLEQVAPLQTAITQDDSNYVSTWEQMVGTDKAVALSPAAAADVMAGAKTSAQAPATFDKVDISEIDVAAAGAVAGEVPIAQEEGQLTRQAEASVEFAENKATVTEGIKDRVPINGPKKVLVDGWKGGNQSDDSWRINTAPSREEMLRLGRPIGISGNAVQRPVGSEKLGIAVDAQVGVETETKPSAVLETAIGAPQVEQERVDLGALYVKVPTMPLEALEEAKRTGTPLVSITDQETGTERTYITKAIVPRPNLRGYLERKVKQGEEKYNNPIANWINGK